MRKSLLAAVARFGFALIIAVVLLACGRSEQPAAGSGAQAAPQEAQRRLSLAVNDSPWLHSYQAAIELYRQSTGVQVDVNIYPHQALYDNQTAAAREEVYVYDVFQADEAMFPFYMSNGYLAKFKDIDPAFEYDPEIIEYASSGRWSASAGYTTADGDIYGMPINGNLQLWFYNAERFREAGLSTPDTFDDVRRAAQQLNRAGFNGYGIISVARIQATYFWMPILWGHGGDIFADMPDDWRVTINSPQALESLNFLAEMKAFAPPGIGNTSQADILSYLANGQLAQAVNVSAVHAFMDNPEFASFPGVIDFAPPPRGVDRASSLGNWVAGIAATSPNKELALDFLRFIASYDAQLVVGEARGVPVRADVYAELAARPGNEWRFFRGYQETFPYARSRPRIPEWPQIEDVIGTHLQEFLVGQITAPQALSQMETAVSRIMRAAGYDIGN